MKVELFLVVQEGCRPCIYAKNNLQRVDGWEKYVKILDASDPEVKPTLLKYRIDGTPTLLAIKNGNDAKTFRNPKEMTKLFCYLI